ncbi:MAG: NAD(P)/FAD-dependent oxidoreductase [Candidatus Sericytochromatia bacterium]
MPLAIGHRPSAIGPFDLAIVGGGLAGLSLAIQQARLGHRVLLCEKEKYPFHKVCGEYIAMESWDFLSRLGVPLAELELPRITRLQVSEPGGEILEHPLDPGGFGISRYSLDARLAAIARAEGVSLLEKTRVRSVEQLDEQFLLSTSAGDFTARVVCGSYGKYANLDLRLQRDFAAPERRKLAFAAVKYHIELDIPDDLIALHNFDGGYCGMSRVDDGRTCLCYLVRADRLKAAGSIPELERTALRRNPHLDKIFTRARFLYEQPLAITQIHFQPKSACEQHVLMLGDAAGVIPPLSGNGMSMALRASALVSPLLHDFFCQRLDRAQLESAYARTWQQAFGTRLRTGKALQHLFGRPGPTTWLIKGLKPFPAAIGKLVDLTHGKKF